MAGDTLRFLRLLKQRNRDMMNELFSRIANRVAPVLTLAAMALTFSSCDRLQEDLDPCPQGLSLRFVYDYNMEFANAFPSQVDCLTVLVYNGEGNYVKTMTESSEKLADENWRMTVDLAPGNYHILAYGGMECRNASFSFVSDPADTKLENVEVTLDAVNITSPIGRNLHPLFYGDLSIGVEATDTHYREATVKMMKDTNNLRIMLQQVGGEAIDNEDFDFVITDDNTLFAYDNAVISTRQVDYRPWTRGNASPGDLPDGESASVAYAEISFPRLVTYNAPRLVISHKEDGRKVVDIPLNNYLLLLKSEQFASMGAQEFLDRESRWSMLFFLSENNEWIRTQIVINDWIVRINDIAGLW